MAAWNLVANMPLSQAVLGTSKQSSTSKSNPVTWGRFCRSVEKLFCKVAWPCGVEYNCLIVVKSVVPPAPIEKKIFFTVPLARSVFSRPASLVNDLVGSKTCLPLWLETRRVSFQVKSPKATFLDGLAVFTCKDQSRMLLKPEPAVAWS